jgi:hypothetical protein
LDIHIKGYILLYKQRKLQGIRSMGLAQTGQRDPCKAPPLCLPVVPACLCPVVLLLTKMF